MSCSLKMDYCAGMDSYWLLGSELSTSRTDDIHYSIYSYWTTISRETGGFRRSRSHCVEYIIFPSEFEVRRPNYAHRTTRVQNTVVLLTIIGFMPDCTRVTTLLPSLSNSIRFIRECTSVKFYCSSHEHTCPWIPVFLNIIMAKFVNQSVHHLIPHCTINAAINSSTMEDLSLLYIFTVIY